MDIAVPKIVGESPYLIKYYGALHAEVLIYSIKKLKQN